MLGAAVDQKRKTQPSTENVERISQAWEGKVQEREAKGCKVEGERGESQGRSPRGRENNLRHRRHGANKAM